MKRVLCATGTTGLLALVLAGYSGGALGQQTCQNEIQQLRSENQQRQVPRSERQRVGQILDRAAGADAGSCAQIVADAREQMEQRQGQSTGMQAMPEQQPAPAQQQPAGARRHQATTEQAGAKASGLANRPENTTMQVQIEQMPATVEVDAGAPRVLVRQQPPKVTVEQQPPLVEITQPKARVNVTQAEPKVTVNQANPQVDIRQSEPQVQVVQAGEPQVRMMSPDDQTTRRASGAQQESPAASRQVRQADRPALVTTGQISLEEASELEGKNVLSSQGQEVGEISDIVRSRLDNELHAVVDVGGFLGIGARSVAIPVQQGQIGEDGNLQVPLSREELEQLPEYDESQYESEL